MLQDGGPAVSSGAETHRMCTGWPGWWRADGQQPQQLQAGNRCPQSLLGRCPGSAEFITRTSQVLAFLSKGFFIYLLKRTESFQAKGDH